MEKNRGNFLAIVLVILCLFLSTTTIVSADPNVSDIATIPENPEPLSTLKVIADVTGNNILSVKVTISECTEGPPEQCFDPHTNLVMELNDDGKYETEVTLTGTVPSIDHLQYAFTVDDDGTEYILTDPSWRTYLDVGTDNDGTNDDGGDNDSPGFELVILLVAVIVGVLLYIKKR